MAAASDVADLLAVVADLTALPNQEALCETREVTLGGVPHVVTIRGRRRDQPVLLVVHGGPGAPLSSTAWMWQRPVEDFFTVVQYDQRAAGRTHALTDADRVRPTLRPERFVDDAVELAAWLVDELGVARVAVLGHSWGTWVATRAVLARPDLFFAYAAVGQVVDVRTSEELSWRWARAEAERRGDADAAAELDALLPYPGAPEDFLAQVSVERRWVERFGGFVADRDSCAFFADGDRLSPDLTDADREAAGFGNALSGEVLVPLLRDLDLTDVAHFPVPMLQVLGRSDRMTPSEPAAAWAAGLDTPGTAIEWFEHSAHLAMYEEPGRFLLALLTHVLPHAPEPGQEPGAS